MVALARGDVSSNGVEKCLPWTPYGDQSGGSSSAWRWQIELRRRLPPQAVIGQPRLGSSSAEGSQFRLRQSVISGRYEAFKARAALVRGIAKSDCVKECLAAK